jgi:hypothetical protein
MRYEIIHRGPIFQVRYRRRFLFFSWWAWAGKDSEYDQPDVFLNRAAAEAWCDRHAEQMRRPWPIPTATPYAPKQPKQEPTP